MSVDRIRVNDTLTALAAERGAVVDDDTLNDLTHIVSDALDGLPAPAERTFTVGPVYLALIEWDSSTDPEIWLGPSWLSVAQRAASRLTDPEVAAPHDWPEVHQELPLTGEIREDPEQLRAWHDAYREGVTVPWVSFHVFGHPSSRQAFGPDGSGVAEDLPASTG